jgi:hypothetical protein
MTEAEQGLGARSGLLNEPGDLEAFVTELQQNRSALPPRVNATAHDAERGLARLVLTVIELLRRLMEQQAIRRIEAGSLTDDEIERMGQTFIRLEGKMAELKRTFGLEDEDLNLNLGPLGNLM